jgi:VIT1/CCC1 family predicted Fe2+/Mn2+ transporter
MRHNNTFFLYSAVLTILFVYFIFAVGGVISSISVWACIFAFAGTSITWYETIRTRRRSP